MWLYIHFSYMIRNKLSLNITLVYIRDRGSSTVVERQPHYLKVGGSSRVATAATSGVYYKHAIIIKVCFNLQRTLGP
jgi:hypothetical protein